MKALSGLARVSIRLAGRELAAPEADALSSLRVRRALSVPACCELSFARPPRTLLDVAAAGAGMEITAGPSGHLFQGEITAVESGWDGRHARELTVRGYDVLHRLRKHQPVRAHTQVTVAGLARDLAGPIGISVTAEADSPVWPWLLQWKQSDLELLVEVAARSGLYLTLSGGVLRVVTLEGSGEPIPLVADEGLLECEVELNADQACRSVDAAGFDLVAVEARRARAEGLRPDRPAAQALAGDDARSLADVPAPSDTHLEAAARAELVRRAASEVVLRGVAEGDPRLWPGSRVALSGIAAPLCGTYVLTSVEHLLDPQRGFLSSVSTEPPPIAPRGNGAGAALGEVTQVEESRGRVRLRLSGHGDVETDWIPVASTGAGGGKGLVALPDVGDLVLVVFHQADPARGVVLAGLWSASGPPDAGVEGGRVRRFALRSASGHQLELDDAGRVLRLSDAFGSFVEMTPKGVKLHAAAPLTIEAPGKSVVLVGDTVDFNRG